MARIAQKRPQKSEVVLAKQGVNNDGKLRTFGLFALDKDGIVDSKKKVIDKGTFLLNPATFEESKTSNWSPQNVPGQSNPVYQWVSGGARQITFEALVTRDNFHAGSSESGDILSNLAGAALNAVGGIASELAGVSLPPLASLFPGPDPGSGTALSIVDKLDYYRSLLHPIYTQGHTSLYQAPPLVVLAAGSTFAGVPTPLDGPIAPPSTKASGSYVPVFIVTSLNIRITKQLPNLDPMEAMVNFTLQEYAIRPISSLNFQSGEPPAGGDSFSLLGAIGSLF